MSSALARTYIFQAQFNGDEWNTIPPLCTDEIDDLMKTVKDLMLNERTNDGSTFVYRVIDDYGNVVLTNDPSGFENVPFEDVPGN